MGSLQKYSVLLTGRVSGRRVWRDWWGGGDDSQTEKDAAAEGGRQGVESAGKEQPGPMQGSVLDEKSHLEAGMRSHFCVCKGVSARGGLLEIHVD